MKFLRAVKLHRDDRFSYLLREGVTIDDLLQLLDGAIVLEDEGWKGERFNAKGLVRPEIKAVLARGHEELMAQFEAQFKGEGRMDREAKELWRQGRVYQQGQVNELFLAFRRGVAYGLAAGRE